MSSKSSKNSPSRKSSKVVSPPTELNTDVMGEIASFMNNDDLAKLRLVNKHYKTAVAMYPWNRDDLVKGSIPVWRRAFPNARLAVLKDRHDLTNEDCEALKGLTELRLINVTIQSKNLEFLRGLKNLNIVECELKSTWFQYLGGLKYLIVEDSYLRDADVALLVNLQVLIIKDEDDFDDFTGVSLRNLKKLHTLKLIDCNNVTNAAFEGLRGLKELTIFDCYGITASIFKNMPNLENLELGYADRDIIGLNDGVFRGLQNLKYLVLSCIGNPSNLSNNLFKHLCKLEYLDIMDYASQKFTSDLLQYLPNLKTFYFTADENDVMFPSASIVYYFRDKKINLFVDVSLCKENYDKEIIKYCPHATITFL